jgi:hypothetical protein
LTPLRSSHCSSSTFIHCEKESRAIGFRLSQHSSLCRPTYAPPDCRPESTIGRRLCPPPPRHHAAEQGVRRLHPSLCAYIFKSFFSVKRFLRVLGAIGLGQQRRGSICASISLLVKTACPGVQPAAGGGARRHQGPRGLQ